MKRILPLIAGLAALAFVASTLVAPKPPGPFDTIGFSKLPILANGRLKPIDTVARTSLLLMQHRQSVRLADGSEVTPQEWIIDVFFRPAKADTYPIFAIDNPDLLTLLGMTDESLAIKYPDTARQILAVLGMIPNHRRRFSFKEIQPHLASIDQQARLAEPVDSSQRTAFQASVLQLDSSLVEYERLKNAVVIPDSTDPLADLLQFQKDLPSGVEAVRLKEAGKPHDEAAAIATLTLGKVFVDMDSRTNLLAIPPAGGSAALSGWRSAGKALLESFQTGSVDSGVLTYAGFSYVWNAGDSEHFNGLVKRYRSALEHQLGDQLSKTDAEVRFNTAAPFYTSLVLYVTAFFLAIGSWLLWPEVLRRCGFWVVSVAWATATAGILCRMWLEGRPPVTNLYSSALFVGWGAVALCLVLEVTFKNAIGTATAGLIGFATLLIAHMLSLSGDTLEMMRAVLDSNFWLGTHVVVVATGYASTFLAGFLAVIYVVRGVFTRSLDEATASSLGKMVYGIVCFATLFSFVGTVLGGIWADQSWGRFWGWDPKENGALIIVVWNALILHARWAGMVRTRGLMGLAIAGNIVTSWSWFGTNMLGVGLHSYGFTQAAFQWLVTFVLSQLVLIGLAALPLEKWRSFQHAGEHRS